MGDWKQMQVGQWHYCEKCEHESWGGYVMKDGSKICKLCYKTLQEISAKIQLAKELDEEAMAKYFGTR